MVNLQTYIEIKMKIRIAHLDRCDHCADKVYGWVDLHHLESELELENNDLRNNMWLLEEIVAKRRWVSLPAFNHFVSFLASTRACISVHMTSSKYFPDF